MKKKVIGSVITLLTACSLLSACNLTGQSSQSSKESESSQSSAAPSSETSSSESKQESSSSIIPEVIHVTSVTLGSKTLALKVGASTVLTADVAPANATDPSVRWESSDEEVVTVNNGTLNALKAGSAIITVTSNDGNKFANCLVTITEPESTDVSVTGISLNKNTLELTKGDEDSSLVATIAPENATNKTFTWVSSDPNVATVNNGVITAVAPGLALIKVTTEDGGFQDTCAVNVKDVQKAFKYTIKSGTKYELSGLDYTFAKGYLNDDVVHVEEDKTNNKTIVYGLKGGIAHLNKGEFSFDIEVNYAVNTAVVGSTVSSLQSRVTNTFKRTTVADDFTVGNKNKLFLDFAVRYDTFVNNKGEWEEDDSADTKLENLGDYFATGEKPTLTVEGHSDYIEVADDLSITFNDAAKDQKFDIKFTAPGALKAQTITVSVQEGYNIHSHAELKSLYEDTTVSGKLILVRNIEAELSADRFYEDSKCVNDDGTHLFPKNIYEEAHTKTNTGSVYNRVFDCGEPQNEIEIVGNYLTIDGRNVPDHAPSTDEGQKGVVYNTLGPTKVPNNGEGIFFISKIRNTFDQCTVATGKALTLRNVKVTANSDRSPVGENNEHDGCEGLAGICAARSNVEVYNSVIDHTERAVYLMGDETSFLGKNTIITDCWGPAVVGYETDSMNLRNCYVSRCGGPALWNYGEQLYDIDINGIKRDLRTSISWDKATEFDNWVARSTPWCVANGVDVSGNLQKIENTVNDTEHSLDWGTIFDQNTYNFICLCMKNRDRSAAGAEAYKDITVLDNDETVRFHANEQPTRFGSSAGQFATNVYGAAGAYICGLGQSDTMMDTTAGQILGTTFGGNTAYAMAAWELAIKAYCEAEIDAGYQAVLDVTAEVPGAGFLCAFCEVVKKTV